MFESKNVGDTNWANIFHSFSCLPHISTTLFSIQAFAGVLDFSWVNMNYWGHILHQDFWANHISVHGPSVLPCKFWLLAPAPIFVTNDASYVHHSSSMLPWIHKFCETSHLQLYLLVEQSLVPWQLFDWGRMSVKTLITLITKTSLAYTTDTIFKTPNGTKQSNENPWYILDRGRPTGSGRKLLLRTIEKLFHLLWSANQPAFGRLQAFWNWTR